MHIVLWVVAVVLALVFLATGLMKLSTTKEALHAQGMHYTEDFSGGTVKLIGLAQVLGAVGLVLPAALDVVPVLVPVPVGLLGRLRRRRPLLDRDLLSRGQVVG